jgi:hypothetical protein
VVKYIIIIVIIITTGVSKKPAASVFKVAEYTTHERGAQYRER